MPNSVKQNSEQEKEIQDEADVDADLLAYNDSGPELEREKDLREFVQKCLKTAEPFTDTSFPPQESSLYEKTEKNSTILPKIIWKRLSDVYPDYRLFGAGNKLNVEDALSGKSGDSYFVAMLASLAS